MKIAIPNKKIRNILRMYTGTLAILYILFGSIEVLTGFGFTPLFVQNSLFFGNRGMDTIPSGITLFVIGAVLLNGTRQYKHSDSVQVSKSISFQFVGLLLSTFFCGLFLLIMGSQWAFSMLNGEAYPWQSELGPGIWLFSLAVPGCIFFLRREQETTRASNEGSMGK